MNTFDLNAFARTLKSINKSIGFVENDRASKELIAEAIVTNNFRLSDVMSYFGEQLKNNTPGYGLTGLNESDWKKIISNYIKFDDEYAIAVEKARETLGKNASNYDVFVSMVEQCGDNPRELTTEVTLDYIGWEKMFSYIINLEDAKVPVEKTKKTKRTKRLPVIVKMYETGEIFGEYSSMTAAEIVTGISNSQISKCCNGKYTHSTNQRGQSFTFEFKDNTKVVETPVVTPGKSTNRYARRPVVIVDRISGKLVDTYKSIPATEKGSGFKDYQIRYSLTSKNHYLGDTLLCMYADEYQDSLNIAA